MNTAALSGDLGEKIVIEIRATDDPFVTAAELSDSLEASRQSINYRLNQLEEAGCVDRKKAGSRAVGWWLID